MKYYICENCNDRIAEDRTFESEWPEGYNTELMYDGMMKRLYDVLKKTDPEKYAELTNVGKEKIRFHKRMLLKDGYVKYNQHFQSEEVACYPLREETEQEYYVYVSGGSLKQEEKKKRADNCCRHCHDPFGPRY